MGVFNLGFLESVERASISALGLVLIVLRIILMPAGTSNNVFITTLVHLDDVLQDHIGAAIRCQGSSATLKVFVELLVALASHVHTTHVVAVVVLD